MGRETRGIVMVCTPAPGTLKVIVSVPSRCAFINRRVVPAAMIASRTNHFVTATVSAVVVDCYGGET